MSDLLNQASLVYIPSGYKEDTAYSVIPTDGSGDLTFTRASDGTRVNSQGLVERVPWNLVTYSEQFDNAFWAKINASITANITTAPNGTTTAETFDEGTISGWHRLYADRTFANGVTYTYSIYAKANTETVVQLNTYNLYASTSFNYANFDLQNGVLGTYANCTPSIESVGNGWYRCSITQTSTINGTGYVYITSANNNASASERPSYTGTNNTFYIWGAQLVEGSTAKPYFPTTDRLNVPRLDYSNGCPSLLLEPQRTNLVTYSEQFDNAAWIKQEVNVTANASIAPDGTQSADKITPTAVTGTHQVRSATLTSITQCAFGVFAKADGYNTITILDLSAATNGAAFNLETGTVSVVGTATATIVPFGNGWYRCIVVTNTTGLRVYVPNESSSFTGNGTSGVLLWGAQLEAGSYPTSYIPTTSASVTRVADGWSNTTGIDAIDFSSGFTLFFDVSNVAPPIPINYTDLWALKDSVTSENIRIEQRPDGTLGLFSNITGLNTLNPTGWLNDGSRQKIATLVASGNQKIYINGTLRASATNIFTMPDFDTFKNDDTLSYTQIRNNVHQAIIFPTALTDAECIALTTL